MNHEPWTMNDEPWTMNHKPWTMNHEPWTMNLTFKMTAPCAGDVTCIE
jgi:hypothetical protein